MFDGFIFVCYPKLVAHEYHCWNQLQLCLVYQSLVDVFLKQKAKYQWRFARKIFVHAFSEHEWKFYEVMGKNKKLKWS